MTVAWPWLIVCLLGGAAVGIEIVFLIIWLRDKFKGDRFGLWQ